VKIDPMATKDSGVLAGGGINEAKTGSSAIEVSTMGKERTGKE